MTGAEDWVVRADILPDQAYEGMWDSIILPPELKERLFNHALLSLRLRSSLSFDRTALHGLLLLYGSPGTGKTTLARAVGHELAPFVADGKVRLIEIDPHGLMSAEHGQSQQQVTSLLCEHLPLLADDGMPTVVLLDEVESMAVARSEASLAANPADVHRATDAVLMALDRNAAEHPHLLTVATSNFTQALDEAFLSRADVSLEFPIPSLESIEAILRAALDAFSGAFPKLEQLGRRPELRGVATELEGLDGRRIRKVVTEALAGRRETVLDPQELTIEDLQAATQRLRKEKDTHETD